MKNKSIWLDYHDDNEIYNLKKNLDVDVLIIGGGMTGLSTAYHLIDSGMKVCLVERNLIAHGVSSRTTGKLTYLQQLIYSKLEKFHSKHVAQLYLSSQRDAISMVESIIRNNNISCDYEKIDSYIFTNNEKDIDMILRERDFLQENGITVTEWNDIPIDIPSIFAISVPNTAVFHPLKYLYALKNICLKSGISIYENTNITKIEKENNKYKCYYNNGYITTKKIVLATHYPYFTIPFFFPLKTTLEKSYICALTVSKPVKLSGITVSVPVHSIRPHNELAKNYAIYLKNSHNISMQINDKENFNSLLASLKQKPKYMWSNIDIMTNDYLPYIGIIDESDPNFFIGTGYNTWGMTNGSLAGKIISDLILGKDNKYQKIFSPLRSGKLINTLNFPISISSNIKSMVQNKLVIKKKWYPKNLKFEKVNGKDVAIYYDKNGKNHKVYTKCPHLGCSLIFNEVELTWDCPCHGSRFDIDGKCIEGPSLYNITYKIDDNDLN